MAIQNYLQFEPPFFVQGDSVAWQVQPPGYVPGTYTLTYYFTPDPNQQYMAPGNVPLVPFPFIMEASDSNGAFTIQARPQDTTQLVPGMYRWQGKVTDGVDVITVSSGRMVVKPSTQIGGAAELQTVEEQLLILVEQALLGRIPRGMESYSIGGRSISKIKITELYKLKQDLQAVVNEQRENEVTANDSTDGTSRKTGRQILVRFDRYQNQPSSVLNNPYAP